MAEQTERSFQKQPNVFLNKKSSLLSAKGKKNLRYTKSIGLGFKTPREAKEAHYIDRKCPFTGNVSIRGRILTGVVAKMKMQRTIVIRRDYLHYVKKYNRFEKRHKNMSVHLSPCFRYIERTKPTILDLQCTCDQQRLASTHCIEQNFLDSPESKDGAYCTISEGSDQNVLLQSHCLSCFGQPSYRRDVQLGDVVTVGECRPLSKTVRFNVLKVTKGAQGKKSFSKF